MVGQNVNVIRLAVKALMYPIRIPYLHRW